MAAYCKVHQPANDTFIKSHATLVKRIAHHLLGRLPQSVQLDDLIQSGMLGLLEAVKNYDVTKGASFETYAAIRIRGHMLDEVRRNDWVPRSVYRNARRMAEVVKQLENQLGREAKDVEIAKELDVSLQEYHDMLQDSASSHVYGFDDLGVTDDALWVDNKANLGEPQAQTMHEDLVSRLSEVIDGLPNKERLVLSLYYEQDLNLKEIGQVLEVGESRISQILSQAILRVRARLTE